jgi:hypothetical protein
MKEGKTKKQIIIKETEVMRKLSLTKILTFIVIVMMLGNLSSVLKVFGVMIGWFGKSLDGLNQFPEGAQTAIAYLSILLVAVMIYKAITNKGN